MVRAAAVSLFFPRALGAVCRFFLPVGWRQSTFLLCDFEQCGIELHKCRIDGSVLLMTGVAGGFFRNLSGGSAVVVGEEGPSAGEPSVFEMNRAHHAGVGLEVSAS